MAKKQKSRFKFISENIQLLTTTKNETTALSPECKIHVFRIFFRINVTFVDKDGEEIHIKVPVGMNILEAAHENDIELEGTIFPPFIPLCPMMLFRIMQDSN